MTKLVTAGPQTPLGFHPASDCASEADGINLGVCPHRMMALSYTIFVASKILQLMAMYTMKLPEIQELEGRIKPYVKIFGQTSGQTSPWFVAKADVMVLCFLF